MESRNEKKGVDENVNEDKRRKDLGRNRTCSRRQKKSYMFEAPQLTFFLGGFVQEAASSLLSLLEVREIFLSNPSLYIGVKLPF